MKTGSHGHPRSQTAQSFLTFPRTFKVFSQRKMIPLFAYSEPSEREKIYFIDKINGQFDAVLISVCGIRDNFCSWLTP